MLLLLKPSILYRMSLLVEQLKTLLIIIRRSFPNKKTKTLNLIVVLNLMAMLLKHFYNRFLWAKTFSSESKHLSRCFEKLHMWSDGVFLLHFSFSLREKELLALPFRVRSHRQTRDSRTRTTRDAKWQWWENSRECQTEKETRGEWMRQCVRLTESTDTLEKYSCYTCVSVSPFTFITIPVCARVCVSLLYDLIYRCGIWGSWNCRGCGC